jgi:hypothetical protein
VAEQRAATSPAPPPATARGLTPREVAHLWRVSPDRVRAMIRRGELQALDMGTPQRPRLVILPEHLQQYARAHRAATTPRAAPRRRRPPPVIDYYPD